jgi:hypothetical protein
MTINKTTGPYEFSICNPNSESRYCNFTKVILDAPVDLFYYNVEECKKAFSFSTSLEEGIERYIDAKTEEFKVGLVSEQEHEEL